MTNEEILKKANSFQGANREFSQELPKIVEALLDKIDEGSVEVVDSLTSNDPTKALSANQGKVLKTLVDTKVDGPETAGTAGQILQLNDEGEPEWVDAAEVGATYDSVVSDTSTNAIQNKAIKAYADDTKAAKDGYYAGLVSGAAENLVGHGSVPASFLFRTSGGDQDLGTGTAQFSELKGNGMVWNQLFAKGGSYNNNGITISFDSTTGIYTISGTATADAIIYLTSVTGWISGSLHANHSGFFSIKKVSGTFSGNSSSDIHPNGNGNPSFLFGSDTEKEVINSYGIDRYPIITIKSGDIFTDYKFRIMCFDLTALFNGEVPENFSVADFKAVYPLGYYASNSGKVIPFAAQNLVTTGFNLWDEEMAKGIINSSGEEAAEGNSFHSKNYIPVFPNTDYSLTRDGCDGILYIAEYDANKNFIVRETKTSSTTSFTTGTGTYFIKVSFYKSGSNWGITLPSFNMCINLSWSGYRNGEYEPYEKHTLVVDPASWVDTDGNLIFPYGGMFKAGSAYDFAKAENDGYFHYGTRVIGRVDLGSLEWTYTSGSPYNWMVSDGLTNAKASNNDVANFITALNLGHYAFNPLFQQYSTENGIAINASGKVVIRDSAYTDAAAFKTAMSGVYLYYELATPVTKELATPVPASYYVNDFGTEEWQPANDDEPYTAPCHMDVAYALNASDTIRRLPTNYISKDSMENLLNALKTAGIISAFTMTYDSEDQEYDFTITAPSEE